MAMLLLLISRHSSCCFSNFCRHRATDSDASPSGLRPCTAWTQDLGLSSTLGSDGPPT